MSTVYFPLTANPVGYHHLLLAECVLRQFSEVKQIVFILSNGRHPDPLKQSQIPDSSIRHQILMQSIREWNNPEFSVVAKVAADEGIPLQMNPTNCDVNRRELASDLPFRLADHIQALSTTGKIKLVIGADLIERMSNPAIFTDSDLHILATKSQLLAANRNDVSISQELECLKNKRGIELDLVEIKLEHLSDQHLTMMQLSSTLIRRAAQAGHELTAFLPTGAQSLIQSCELYEQVKTSQQLGEWQKRCFVLQEELELAAGKLKRLLDEMAAAGHSVRFSALETCTGGLFATHFTAMSGASKHFVESRVLYAREAQERFLGHELETSSVSENHVKELALVMKNKTQADWTIAETGMAGPPSKNRRSRKNGVCHLGLAFQDEVMYKYLELNPFWSRKEHQLKFAVEMCLFAESVLKNKLGLKSD